MKQPPPTSSNHTGKIGPWSTDRSKASAPTPSDMTGRGETNTQIYTYLTNAGPTAILYNGDRMWARVTLTLETAGPVAVGQANTLTPVLSGIGQLLQTGEPTPFVIAKGTRLYIASTGINRVAVSIEPFAWLETITGLITSVLGALGRAPGALINAVTSKL